MILRYDASIKSDKIYFEQSISASQQWAIFNNLPRIL